MSASALQPGSTTATGRLSETFGIRPEQRDDYLVRDPVLTVSHNSTYDAPEEMMTVPLPKPTVITFGATPSGQIHTLLPHLHLQFPCLVHDRIQNNNTHTEAKQVDLAALHGAIIFRDQMLFYKHLGDQPTVLAERIFGSRIITQVGAVVPIRRGQTVGFGASSDAFGGRLWWYYFRMTSMSLLRHAVRG